MKQLQRNFTTPEQSKRLLELGVPADSADLYCVVKNNYIALLNEDVVYSLQEQQMIKVSKTTYREELKKGEDILPCWSVGRLIEICCISMGMSGYPHTFENQVANLILMLSQAKKHMSVNFSKLDEYKYDYERRS